MHQIQMPVHRKWLWLKKSRSDEMMGIGYIQRFSTHTVIICCLQVAPGFSSSNVLYFVWLAKMGLVSGSVKEDASGLELAALCWTKSGRFVYEKLDCHKKSNYIMQKFTLGCLVPFVYWLTLFKTTTLHFCSFLTIVLYSTAITSKRLDFPTY